MSKTYLWLHNIEKDFYKLVQLLRESFTTTPMGFETWDGWLIAGNTHNIFVIQNKLILPAYIHFKTILLFLIFPHISPTQQKNFFGYWRIFQIIPYPPPTLKIAW